MKIAQVTRTRRGVLCLLATLCMPAGVDATTIMIWWQKDQVIIAADSLTRRNITERVTSCKARVLGRKFVFFAAGHYRPSEAAYENYLRQKDIHVLDVPADADSVAEAASNATEAANAFSALIKPYFQERRSYSKDQFNQSNRLFESRLTFCFMGRIESGEMQVDCRDVMFYRHSNDVAILPYDAPAGPARHPFSGPPSSDGLFEVISLYSTAPLVADPPNNAFLKNEQHRLGWLSSASHGSTSLDRIRWIINNEIDHVVANTPADQLPAIDRPVLILTIVPRTGHYEWVSRPKGEDCAGPESGVLGMGATSAGDAQNK